MAIKKEKALLLTSVLWAIISMPLSQIIFDEMHKGFIMRLFDLILVNSPIFAVYGIIWLTEKALTKATFIAYSLFSFFFFIYLSQEKIGYIALLCFFAFSFLYLINRNDLVQNNGLYRNIVDDIESEKTSAVITYQDLIEVTETIANRLRKFLQKYPEPMGAHLITKDHDCISIAYTFVYLKFVLCNKNPSTRLAAEFAFYKTDMVTNLLKNYFPKRLAELAPDFDMSKDPENRKTMDSILKIREESARKTKLTIDEGKISLLPLFEILKRYIGGADATSSELSANFEQEFTDIFKYLDDFKR